MGKNDAWGLDYTSSPKIESIEELGDVPFYISNQGYGVLINSSQGVKIHMGVGNRKDGKRPELIDRTTGKNWSAKP